MLNCSNIDRRERIPYCWYSIKRYWINKFFSCWKIQGKRWSCLFSMSSLFSFNILLYY